MKYDRTKDERNVKRYAKVELEEWEGIVLIDLDEENFEVARCDNCTKPEWLMNGDNYGDLPFSRILKTANTIEELCDEFVLLDKELNHRHIVISSKGFMPSEDYELYGAIWTDKGLIYVAKMNDKGELELL